MTSLEYFARISSFGPSELMLVLVLAADIAFTAIHIWQEWKGQEYPLYRAFGAIVGLWFPHEIGFALFTVVLALVQWSAGIVAYTGCLGMPLGIGALGFVLGARVADSVISHWILWLADYRPNPGLSSTLLYSLEACLIVFAFRRGLAIDPLAAGIGIAIGVGFFLSVLPTMALLRVCLKPCRRPRWVRNTPIPNWAITT